MNYRTIGLALGLFGCGGSDGSGPAASVSVNPALRAKVEQSTGWTFTSAPAFATLSRQELVGKLEAKLQGEAGRRTAAAGRALEVLGVLPRNYDLLSNLKKAYAEELLALYEPKERKVFLVREALDKPLSADDLRLQKAGMPTTRDIVIAHEMVHALQHQHDPLFDLLEDPSPDLDDVRTALHYLAEGEATVHMYALLGPRNAEQISMRLYRESESKLLDQPPFLRDVMFEPYIWGTRYVESRVAGREAGSAPQLHAAPPLSMEHVLHSDRKPEEDPPVAVLLPDLASAVQGGRSLTYEGVLGERDLSYVFSAVAPKYQASGFPGGWGGDRLHLYEKPGQPPVAVLLIRFDRPSVAFVAYAQLGGPAPDKTPPAVAWNGRDLAAVYGLAPEAGVRVAKEALGRLVAQPFKTPAELRSIRASAKYPPSAPADLGNLDRNFEAIAADGTEVWEFQLAVDTVERTSTRLAWIGAARFNLARKGKEQVRFALGRVGDRTPSGPWSPEELDLLIRGGGRTDVNSAINEKLGECLVPYGREWSPELVASIVTWHLLQRKAVVPEFLRKNLSVPGVARAALRNSWLGPIDPASRDVLLKAVEDGIVNPSDSRVLGVDATTRSRLALAHAKAGLNGRIEWTNQDIEFYIWAVVYADAMELPAIVIERWESLSLPPKAKGCLLGQSFRDPKGWKRSMPLARKELEKSDIEFWKGFFEPFGFSAPVKNKELPHFKELLATFETLAQEPVVAAPFVELVRTLRR